MKIRHWKLIPIFNNATALTAVSVLFTGCFFDPSAVMRYEITASVEINGIIISTSAVQEIRAEALTTFGFPQQMTSSYEHRGQSMMVDLANHQKLIFPLTDDAGGGSYAWEILTACGLISPDINERQTVEMVRDFAAPCIIPVEKIPAIIRIDAETTPIAASWIDPKDPQETLGPSVRILSLHLSKTDLPLKFDLQEKLSWLADAQRPNPLVLAKYKELYIDLHTSDFIRSSY